MVEFAVKMYEEINEQLLIEQREQLGEFYGREFVIPQPPDDFFSALRGLEKRHEVARAEIYFNPHYIFEEDEQLPGWKVKPGSYFWRAFKDGLLKPNAPTLRRAWCIDLSPDGKPDFRDPEKELWFGHTPIQIDHDMHHAYNGFVWGVSFVRMRKCMEFNVRGNMVHPEWGKNSSMEWFNDELKNGDRLCGGSSSGGGLAHVTAHNPGYGAPYLTYSVVLEFPV